VELLKLIVCEVVLVSNDVIALTLRRPDGSPLPIWAPGAHLDLELPSGRRRQYSLCGDQADRENYRIAVLRETHGRGGSLELHTLARIGLELTAHEPRNHFPLLDGSRYLFIAGGIGITPILPMIIEAARQGIPWVLIYVGRTRDHLPFLDEVKRIDGGLARILPRDEVGRVDFSVVFSVLSPETLVYACGSPRLLKSVEDAALSQHAESQLRMERFTMKGAYEGGLTLPFDVELARTGKTLHVPVGRTLGEVLKEAGAPVEFSCEEGCCGVCETRVIAGLPDHRDCILTRAERARNDRMMVCTGRSYSPLLVLDL